MPSTFCDPEPILAKLAFRKRLRKTILAVCVLFAAIGIFVISFRQYKLQLQYPPLEESTVKEGQEFTLPLSPGVSAVLTSSQLLSEEKSYSLAPALRQATGKDGGAYRFYVLEFNVINHTSDECIPFQIFYGNIRLGSVYANANDLLAMQEVYPDQNMSEPIPPNSNATVHLIFSVRDYSVPETWWHSLEEIPAAFQTIQYPEAVSVSLDFD